VNGGPTYREAFFGEEWPEVAAWRQVPTPTGMKCMACNTEILMGEQGTFVRVEKGPYVDLYPLHRRCPQPDTGARVEE
jgi:hypothetical protein